MNNIKKNYSGYSIDSDNYDENLENYPKDAYVKNTSNKKVGRLDNYSKEKENFNNEKSRIILNESNNFDKKLDDLIPNQIGDAIDNVFSSVDNLLTKTGKLLFGSAKKKKNTIIKQNTIPIIKNTNKIVNNTNNIQKNTNTQKLNNTNNIQKNANIQNKPQVLNEQKIRIEAKKNPIREEIIKESPPITRTTTISELDLPLEILSDTDIVRYFDQMKLYDKKVEGGLCSLTFNDVEEILKKGRWGKYFMIKYEQLKINTMIAGYDAPLKRFNGMLPVYKALARKFSNTASLKEAIEDDISSYLRTGTGNKGFHKFTYSMKK